MGKWIDRIKEKDNDHALSQGDRVDTPVNELTLSTMSPHTSCIVKKNPCIDICTMNELRAIIKKVSPCIAGDDEYFFEWIHGIKVNVILDRE